MTPLPFSFTAPPLPIAAPPPPQSQTTPPSQTMNGANLASTTPYLKKQLLDYTLVKDGSPMTPYLHTTTTLNCLLYMGEKWQTTTNTSWTYPLILGTMSKGAPIHSHLLYPHSKQCLPPPYSGTQKGFFHPNQPFKEWVDFALMDENDNSLTA